MYNNISNNYTRAYSLPPLPEVDAHLAFAKAIEENDRSSLLGLLESQNINAKGVDDTTPMHLAVLHGNEEAFTELMKRNAQVDEDSKLGTPLDLAIERENVSFCSRLIISGARLPKHSSLHLRNVLVQFDSTARIQMYHLAFLLNRVDQVAQLALLKILPDSAEEIEQIWNIIATYGRLELTIPLLKNGIPPPVNPSPEIEAFLNSASAQAALSVHRTVASLLPILRKFIRPKADQ